MQIESLHENFAASAARGHTPARTGTEIALPVLLYNTDGKKQSAFCGFDEKILCAAVEADAFFRSIPSATISFPVRGKRYGRKGRCLLRNRHHETTQKKDGHHRPPLLPIYASLPKDPVIVGDGGVGAPKIRNVRLRAQEPKMQAWSAFWKGRNELRE